MNTPDTPGAARDGSVAAVARRRGRYARSGSKQEERWLIDRIQIENMWVTGNSSVLFGRRLALP
jgi:hypothetical protein